jgi:hypothetical protein
MKAYLDVLHGRSHSIDGQVREETQDKDGGQHEHHPRGSRRDSLAGVTSAQ